MMLPGAMHVLMFNDLDSVGVPLYVHREGVFMLAIFFAFFAFFLHSLNRIF